MTRVVLEFDDFGKDNHELPILFALKERYPDFKVTMFTIADQITPEFIASLPGWIEVALHGENHEFKECENWTAERVREYCRTYGQYCDSKLFRPPHWSISTEAIEEFRALGWSVCLHPEDTRRLATEYTYNWNLGSTPELYRELLFGHGHVQNVCGNGIEESLENIALLPTDTEFLFLSDVIDGERSFF